MQTIENGKAFAETLLQLSGLYHYYERKLQSHILHNPLPNHVAIILDGNRRWARLNFLNADKGHFEGADKAEELLNWIHDIGIRITTLYILSTENLNRNDEEINNIYDLLCVKLQRLYHDSRIHKRKMKIKAIGNVKLVPPKLQKILYDLEKATCEYDSMFLNIAVAYGGQKELVDAIKRIAGMAVARDIRVEDINEKTIESCLYTSHLPQPEPDLVLRTSGEKRLSGFLLWQSAYSEIVFMDVFWPQFRKIDFMRAIRIYQNRVRKYGL
ncbi:MAG: di-trans,poly-cis-decaprenylcistransferase [Nitrososphaeraceae archaeon]|nr:di-trans,poly-cis-decaprenylcistransferase [Nitrososphaeraceae archaeon]